MKHLKTFESTNDSGKRITLSDLIKHYFTDFMQENNFRLDKEIYNPDGYHEYENGDFSFLLTNDVIDGLTIEQNGLTGYSSLTEIHQKLSFITKLDDVKKRLEKMEGVLINFALDCDFTTYKANGINDETESHGRVDITIDGKHLYDY